MTINGMNARENSIYSRTSGAENHSTHMDRILLCILNSINFSTSSNNVTQKQRQLHSCFIAHFHFYAFRLNTLYLNVPIDRWVLNTEYCHLTGNEATHRDAIGVFESEWNLRGKHEKRCRNAWWRKCKKRCRNRWELNGEQKKYENWI